MSAERDDPLALADAADARGFVAELVDLYGATDNRRSGIDDPDARGLAVVVERAERDFPGRGRLVLGHPYRDGCAKRRLRRLAVKHVARLVGPRCRIGRVGELPQQGMRWGHRASIGAGLRLRADYRAHGLGQVHHGLPQTRTSELHHGLAGAHHLAWFGQSLYNGAFGVGAQDRVGGLIARDLCLRFGGYQLCRGAVAKCLGLFVFLLRCPAARAKLAITCFIGRGLLRRRACRDNGVLFGRPPEIEICLIEPHQRIARADGLTDIDKALDHFAGNPEAEVALHTRRDDTCECTRGARAGLCSHDLNELRPLPRIALDRGRRSKADARCPTDADDGGHNDGGKDHRLKFHGVS